MCRYNRSCCSYQDYKTVFHWKQIVWFPFTIDSGHHRRNVNTDVGACGHFRSKVYWFCWSVISEFLHFIPSISALGMGMCDYSLVVCTVSGTISFRAQKGDSTGDVFWMRCQVCTSTWSRVRGLSCYKWVPGKPGWVVTLMWTEESLQRQDKCWCLVSHPPTHSCIHRCSRSPGEALQSTLRKGLIPLLRLGFWWDEDH